MTVNYSNEIVKIADVEKSRCNVALPVEIKHGRSGAASQPDAPELTFVWLGEVAPGKLGDSITVEVGRPDLGDATWDDPDVLWVDQGYNWIGQTQNSFRFVGTITGLKAVEEGGVVTQWEVRGTGVQALLGYRGVLLDRPVETDVDRVLAIAEAAGIPIQIQGHPGVTLAADTIDKDALSALHEICVSSGGLLWQARNGGIFYGAGDHRAYSAFRVLPCQIVLDGVEWSMDVELIFNHITIKWGPENSQTQRTFRDDDSIAEWELRHVEISTLLAEETDASTLGALVLARRRKPFWRMPGVVVDYGFTTPPERRMMLDLEVSDGVLLPIDIYPNPTPASMNQWTLEGWVEVFDADSHRMQLALTDRLRWTDAPLRNWDIAEDYDWQHWADRSWLDQLVDTESVPAPTKEVAR